jgi:CspA family cold shock protein
MNGTIKKVVADRGFGFIQAEDGREFFFHRSEVDGNSSFDSLRGGEAIEFEPIESPKGPRASRVRVV